MFPYKSRSSWQLWYNSTSVYKYLFVINLIWSPWCRGEILINWVGWLLAASLLPRSVRLASRWHAPATPGKEGIKSNASTWCHCLRLIRLCGYFGSWPLAASNAKCSASRRTATLFIACELWFRFRSSHAKCASEQLIWNATFSIGVIRFRYFFHTECLK